MVIAEAVQVGGCVSLCCGRVREGRGWWEGEADLGCGVSQGTVRWLQLAQGGGGGVRFSLCFFCFTKAHSAQASNDSKQSMFSKHTQSACRDSMEHTEHII